MKQRTKSTATYSKALKIHVSQKTVKNSTAQQYVVWLNRVMCWKYLSGGSMAAWRVVSASTAKLLSSSEDVLHAPKLEKQKQKTTHTLFYMRGSGYLCAIQQAGGRFLFFIRRSQSRCFPIFPAPFVLNLVRPALAPYCSSSTVHLLIFLKESESAVC